MVVLTHVLVQHVTVSSLEIQEIRRVFDKQRCWRFTKIHVSAFPLYPSMFCLSWLPSLFLVYLSSEQSLLSLPPRFSLLPCCFAICHSQELKENVAKFRHEWEISGPMVQGISPLEAVERLRRFKEEMQLRERKVRHYTLDELSAFRSGVLPKFLLGATRYLPRKSRVH